MKIIRSSFTYSAFTMVSRVAGFVRDIIFANYLGSGVIADVFYVAFRFPNTFRRIFSEGAFNSAFVPIYSKLISEDKNKEASEFAGNSLFILLSSTILLVAIIEKFNGSLEFSFAKKIGVRIFTKIKAIRPKEKTFRAIEEL